MTMNHKGLVRTEAEMESPCFSQGQFVRDSLTERSSVLNLQKLKDEHLIHQTETLVREERELLTTILHHFREIDHRRLYSSYGFKSLFEMAVKRFGYSEDQAYRRISAMRLLKEIPEIEEKINSGELTLTNLS